MGAILTALTATMVQPSLQYSVLISNIAHCAAGVLIIWDRMFGTFQPELREEKVIYGLVHPLSSWDPVWAQVHPSLFACCI